MTAARVTAVVAAILVLAGCASARPASQDVKPQASSVAFDLLAEAGDYSAQEQALRRAEETLVSRCMRAAGFAYSVPTRYPTFDDVRPDLATRHRSGYGVSDQPSEGPTSAAYQTALTGGSAPSGSVELPSGSRFTYSTKGCLASSRASLYGSPEAATRVFYLPQEIRLGLLAPIQSDPAYRASAGRWASCMAARGQRFVSPAAAQLAVVAKYRRLGSTAAARSYDIRVAVADGECRWQAGLPTVTDRLTRRFAAQLLPAERSALAQVVSVRTLALRRAAQF